MFVYLEQLLKLSLLGFSKKFVNWFFGNLRKKKLLNVWRDPSTPKEPIGKITEDIPKEIVVIILKNTLERSSWENFRCITMNLSEEFHEHFLENSLIWLLELFYSFRKFVLNPRKGIHRGFFSKKRTPSLQITYIINRKKILCRTWRNSWFFFVMNSWRKYWRKPNNNFYNDIFYTHPWEKNWKIFWKSPKAIPESTPGPYIMDTGQFSRNVCS